MKKELLFLAMVFSGSGLIASDVSKIEFPLSLLPLKVAVMQELQKIFSGSGLTAFDVSKPELLLSLLALKVAVTQEPQKTVSLRGKRVSLVADLCSKQDQDQEYLNRALTDDGKTLLHLAVESGHYQNVFDLLTHLVGLNVNSKDTAGKTPFDLAKDARMRAVLALYGAQPNAQKDQVKVRRHSDR